MKFSPRPVTELHPQRFTRLNRHPNPIFRYAFLIFVVVTALAVRWVDLGSHFTHVDDMGVAKTILEYKSRPIPLDLHGLKKLHFYWENWTAVSRHWTYAPAQFFVTTLFVNPNQSYRQILFWGRLPSLIFSILSLLLWIYFYKRYDHLQTPAVSLSLVLLAFSWMHVIYAKQMASFAIGIFSAVVILILLWEQIQPGRHSLKLRVLGAVIIAALSHTQYQILFFAPAYFLTLFWHDWSVGRDRKRAILNLLIPGFIFAALIYPMYIAFLKRQSPTAGVHWNAGAHHEFQLIFEPNTALVSQIAQAFLFFLRNIYIVLGSITAWIPEEGILFQITRCVMFIFFSLGIYQIARSSLYRKKMLALFFLISALTWAYLILIGKLTLSPTRHSLVLLPSMVFLCAEGCGLILRQFKKLGKNPWGRVLSFALPAFILGSFFIYMPGRIQERQDPFDENKIRDVLTRFQVDALFTTSFTQNPAIMPAVLKSVNYFENETPEVSYTPRTSPPFKTIAFIGHRDKLTPDIFNLWRYKTRVLLTMRNQPYFQTFGNPQDYQMLYREEIESKTQIEPNDRTLNGTNSFYFYVLTQRDKPTVIS